MHPFRFTFCLAAAIFATPSQAQDITVGEQASACNRAAPTFRSQVRNVPSTRAFKIVAEVANGTPMQVLDIVTNSTGTRYAFVEFAPAAGAARTTGFLSTEQLAVPFCPSTAMPADEAATEMPLPSDFNNLVGRALTMVPRIRSGWGSDSTSLAGAAASWFPTGGASVQLAYVCSTANGTSALLLRIPPSTAASLPIKSGKLGVAIADDIPFTVTENGKAQKISGGTVFVVKDVLDDPIVQGGKMVQLMDTDPAWPDGTHSWAFAKARREARVKFYDPSIELIPNDSDFLLEVSFPAKGSTAAFQNVYAACGISVKRQ